MQYRFSLSCGKGGEVKVKKRCEGEACGMLCCARSPVFACLSMCTCRCTNLFHLNFTLLRCSFFFSPPFLCLFITFC